MANLTVKGNPLGSGTFTVEPPNSNTSRTLTLPDATTTLVGTDATQTLTNKTIQGGSITRDTAKASTSGTTVDFTGIPSWAKRVTVLFSAVSTSGTSLPIIQLGDAGGFENSGYAGSTASMAASSVATVLWGGTGAPMRGAWAATSVLNGKCVIENISGNIWVFTITGGQTDLALAVSGGGAKTLSDTLTQIRVTTVNGTDTFDAGSINIMYEG